MQVTVDIPDALAARLRDAGLDPTAAAQNVLAAKAYQRLLDHPSLIHKHEGVRQVGLDVAAGRTRPAREVFGGMRRRYALPR